MIYTVENTVEAGRPVKHVFDANGLEYVKCIEVDTETGRIVQFRTIIDGDVEVIESDGSGEPVTETIWAAPPLLLIFKN
jgi:hypothetical protein